MKRSLFLFSFFFLITSLSMPQENNKNVRIIRNEKGIIQIASFRNLDKSIKVPESANAFFKDYLEIGQNDVFHFTRDASKKQQFKHEHYD